VNLELLAACILSGQVEAADVVRLCAEHPGLAELLRPSPPPFYRDAICWNPFASAGHERS
jgi:hypothetical protein